MPTYVYETIPDDHAVPVRRFEVKQGMLDTPLKVDPESGSPVRRVISGGMGYLKRGEAASPPPGG